MEQFPVENQRSEEKCILSPLPETHCFKEGAQHGYILPAIQVYFWKSGQVFEDKPIYLPGDDPD